MVLREVRVLCRSHAAAMNRSRRRLSMRHCPRARVEFRAGEPQGYAGI